MMQYFLMKIKEIKEMNDDEKNFIRKVNIDKARNVSKIAMVLIIISILT